MSSEFSRRLSVALNVALAVAAVSLARHKPEPSPQTPVNVTDKAPEAAPIVASRQPHYPEAAAASDKRRWLVDQLRARGVPSKVLVRLVMEDLDKGWTKRAAEVSMKYHGDPEAMAALQLETDKSKDAEMRAALGEEGFQEWDRGNMLREANQGKIKLTAAETDAIYDTWKKKQQRELELEQARVDGTMDDADLRDAQDKADAEYKDQMKAVLGEDRYAKSQQTGAGDLQDLAKAKPTDSQFQELLKAQEQWNSQRAALDKQSQEDPSSSEYAARIKALDASRDEEYRRVLGADVFDALQKNQDPGYAQMKKYESLWGLDDNKIDSVYGALRYFQKNVDDYQARVRALEAQGQNVDWDAVNKNLQQFADDTQQSLQNYLGRDNFTRMARNGVFQLNPSEMTGHSSPAQ